MILYIFYLSLYYFLLSINFSGELIPRRSRRGPTKSS